MLLGAGKTPQVTQDAVVNPLTIPYDDITPMAFIYSSLASNWSASGSPLNVTNPNYDYVTNAPYTITKAAVIANDTSYVYIDIGKILYLRGVTLFWSATGGAAAVLTVTPQYSEDGTLWTNLAAATTFSPNASVSQEINKSKLRFIRFKLDYNDGAGTGATFILRRIYLQLDSIQMFYS